MANPKIAQVADAHRTCFLVYSRQSTQTASPPYSGDVLLMKLSLEGDMLWKRAWGGNGYEQVISFFLLKMTTDGSEDWLRTYGGPGQERPYGMLRLSNRDLLSFGFSETGASADRNQYALLRDGTYLTGGIGLGVYLVALDL